MVSINQMTLRADQISRRTKQVLAMALLTAIATGMTISAKGQTFAEWFQQKKTQRKYLLEQIAALGTYAGYVQKGYAITQQGTGAISGCLEEEWEKHAAFYSRKQKVAPAFRDNPQVSEILKWQKAILSHLKKLYASEGFSGHEIHYLKKVGQSVMNDCMHQAALLEKAYNDGQLTMSDEERLQLIARIHDDMSGNLRFTTGFVNQALLYASRKQRQLASTNNH